MKKNNGLNTKKCSIVKGHAGFTLIEVLTVTLLIAIVSAITVPNVVAWQRNAQLTGISRDIYASFQKAKVEAIKRKENCAITFGTNGYVVYVDDDKDFVQDAGEEVIKTVSFSDYGGVAFDTNEGGGDGLTFGNPTNGIAFSSTGLPTSAAGVGTGSIFLKHLNDKTASIDVSPSGSIRLN